MYPQEHYAVSRSKKEFEGTSQSSLCENNEDQDIINSIVNFPPSNLFKRKPT